MFVVAILSQNCSELEQRFDYPKTVGSSLGDAVRYHKRNANRDRAASTIKIMTRSELIEQLSLSHPQLTLKDIELTIHTILDEMARTLANGGRAEIRGFGSFNLNHRPPRKGRNPKTGKSIMVPAKYVPHFRPGKELRKRVDIG